jgi:DNA-binding CsgD family transcriptional regulator
MLSPASAAVTLPPVASSIERLIAQRKRVLAAEKRLKEAREEQVRRMVAAADDRYRNSEIARAIGISRERVGKLLKEARGE